MKNLLRISFLLVALLWRQNIYAQDLTVKITEIAPLKIQAEEEWFEFLVQGSSVDMSQWKVSNGKTSKSFMSAIGNLRYSESEVLKSESALSLNFSLPLGFGFFFWTKSPLSLPNDGGKIQILDENNQILSEVEYPKLKEGTIGGNPYNEIWTLDLDLNEFYPVRYEPFNPDPFFHHSPGLQNPAMPLRGEEFELYLQEITPDEAEHDFIELKLKPPSREKASLPRITLKHNGSPLWEGRLSGDKFPFLALFSTQYAEFSQSKSDSLIQFQLPHEGISAGSGTFEITTWTGTSWEKNEDFFCFQDEVLSQTEAARVIKFQNSGEWTGPCLEISNLPSGASVGRLERAGDTNTSLDFSFWPHPTPGAENTLQNNPPVALIKVQNELKSVLEVPFSINFSAENSSDPDGEKDIIAYRWTVNEVPFSTSLNPGYYRIEDPGDYVFTLEVTDVLGAKSLAEFMIKAIKPIPQNVPLVETSQDLIQALLDKGESENEDLLFENSELENPFWGDFFSEIKEGKKPLILKNISKEPSELYYSTKTLREKAFLFQNKDKIRKNLGLIFCENY